MAADLPDLEDLLPYASTSVAAGERRTEVEREDSLGDERRTGDRGCQAAARRRDLLARTARNARCST
jgi:hypothetical protein